jgi:predicted nucleic acid-binding protein
VIVLADSDILIDVMRAREPNVLLQWKSLSQSGSPVLYSPVSAAEVWAGARAGEHSHILTILCPLICTTIRYETGRLAGEFLLQYSKSHGLKIGDALIAAGAIEHQASLWTRNRKHYPMKNLAFY